MLVNRVSTLTHFFSLLSVYLQVAPHIVGAVQQIALSSKGAAGKLAAKLLPALKNGQAFHDVMAPHLKHLPVAAQLIRAGEESNNLLGAVQDTTNYLKWRQGYQKSMALELAYPVLLFVVFWSMVWGFFYSFVPQFSGALKQMHNQQHDGILFMSQLFRVWPLLMAVLPFVVIAIGGLSLKWLWPNTLRAKINMLMGLNYLLQNGFNVSSALRVVVPHLKMAPEESLRHFFKEARFDAQTLALIEAAEESHQVHKTVALLCQQHQLQQQHKQQATLKFVTPALILSLGVFVMWVLARFMLPLYSQLFNSAF